MNCKQVGKVNIFRNAANVWLVPCQTLMEQIEQAKNRLAAEFKDSFRVQEELFRLALTEAEALAWQTEYPQLFFPTLAREKIQAVAAWQARQDSLRRTGARFAAAS